MFETTRSFFSPPVSKDFVQSAAKAIWIVRLRWIALCAQVVTIYPALEFEVLEPRLVSVFVGVIVVLAVFNILTWLGLRRQADISQAQLLFQLGGDIVALSTLLALSGGAWNPMVPILFVHAMLGAMLLQGSYSLVLAVMLMGCLGLIQVNSHIPPRLEGVLMPATILFPAQFVVAGVFFIVTAWLSTTLNAFESHLAESRERKTRIDRLRAVGALAAGLSHELATPLNTAQLRLSRAARNNRLESDPDLLTAREELERCGEVLRNMAGSQLDPERLGFERVDIDLLAKQVCTSLSKVYPDIKLRFRAEGRGPRQAVIPAVAFSQALINLIDNAVESAGNEHPVDVVVHSDGGHVELTVADRGAGWPQMVKSHLGEPFVTTKIDGVGLGLYYVHSLSEAMGATLHLEDRRDGGAVARISLPAPGPVGAVDDEVQM